MASRFPEWRVFNLSVCFAFILAVEFAGDGLSQSPTAKKPKEVYDSQAMTIAMQDPKVVASQSKVPPGFSMQLVASEPMVRQPIAMDWDSRGRLWIVENYTFSEARVGFDLELSDRILILEDTDGNGSLDHRTVFWDEGKKLTSIAIDGNGVWAQTTPDLLYIRDADHDDRPDGPPQVVLNGFAEGMHHNFANGLKFGPDGWLYGRHGITGVSSIGFPEGSELHQRAMEREADNANPRYSFEATGFRGVTNRQSLHCGIWRLNTRTFEFQVVCQGTTNPWGMDWDRFGNLFFINTVIGHLWHAIPNSHLQRMFGEDLDPYTYELLPQIADHVHWDAKGEDWTAIRKTGVSPLTDKAGGGHAHSGMMIYQSDNWPKEYRNQLFTLNLHGQRINQDHLEREGAGFVGKHGQDVVHWNDPWFRGIELSSGPDGSVYVIDWSDIGECHENDGVHRTSGRIYRISYGSTSDTTMKRFPNGLTSAKTSDLVELLAHPNIWFARISQRLLAGDKKPSSDDIQKLQQWLFSTSDQIPSETRLRALWTLNELGLVDASTICKLLSQTEPEEIHAAVLRLVADRGLSVDDQTSRTVYESIVGLASKKNLSGLVRLYLAALQPRLALDWRLATILGQSSDLATDRDFPLVMWYGIKDRVAAEPIAASKFTLACKVPKLNELIIRRLVSLYSTHPEPIEWLLSELVHQGSEDQIALTVRGMWAGFEGRRSATVPKTWNDFAARSNTHADHSIREKTVLLQALFGKGVSLEDLIQLAKDNNASITSRKSAIESLGSVSDESARSTLWSLLSDQNLGESTARSIARQASAEEMRRMVAMYGKVQRTGKQGIVQSLLSKSENMALLIEAIELKTIPMDAVDASAWRKFQMVADWPLLERARRLNPQTLQLSTDKEKAIQELESLLTDERLEKADASRGRAVWQTTCANCHKLFGEGGQIGPELTGAQRTNKRYWLENIVAPSAQVAQNFRIVLFQLSDDTVISGVPIQETPDTVTIQTEKEKLHVEVSEIRQRKSSILSLMPEGILVPLSEQSKLDLFRYLMSPGQVAISKP